MFLFFRFWRLCAGKPTPADALLLATRTEPLPENNGFKAPHTLAIPEWAKTSALTTCQAYFTMPSHPTEPLQTPLGVPR